MNTHHPNQNSYGGETSIVATMEVSPPYSRLLSFLVVSAVIVLALAVPAAAEAAAEWKGLVPACGARSESPTAADGSKTTTYTPCSTCDLAKLVKNALDFVWYYVALAGVALMLMIGGFQMITGAIGGSATAHQKGLSTIKNAFIGLAIVLFAWLAVDTIIKFIAQQSLTSGTAAELFKDAPGPPVPDPDNSISSTEVAYGFWNQIKCTTLDTVRVTTRPPPRSALGGTVAQALGPEYVCPSGVTSHIVNGIDVCDPLVRQNLENNARNPEGSTLRAPQGNRTCISRSLSRFRDAINAENAQFAPGEGNLFQALLIRESNGREDPPIGSGGAVGVGQVRPSTARGNPELRSELANMDTGQIINWLRIGPNNIRASAAVLRACMRENAGNRARALACYNGGQYANANSVHCNGGATGVTRWQCPYDSFSGNGATCWPNPSSSECRRNTGYQETRDYVPAVERMTQDITDGRCNPLL